MKTRRPKSSKVRTELEPGGLCSLSSLPTACSCTGVPLQSRGPHPMFFGGLAQTPYLPGPGSSSYRSAGNPPAVGHPTCLPKTETANSNLLPKQDLSWGVEGCGMFPQPAPRGPGEPAGTKKAWVGGRKGPRQTGQAATTECEDGSDAVETQ